MNVNRVYIAQIYINFYYKLESDLLYHKQGKYLKQALIYHDEHHNYIDMLSGEEYKLGIESTYLGDMYINLKEGLIPIKNVLNVSFKKQDMSKKKILKSINKAILLNKKEDDK